MCLLTVDGSRPKIQNVLSIRVWKAKTEPLISKIISRLFYDTQMGAAFGWQNLIPFSFSYIQRALVSNGGLYLLMICACQSYLGNCQSH